jgi:hypothetical protein
MSHRGCRPFGEELRDLLIAKGITTGTGNACWATLASRMPGVHYETLRKAVTGERLPSHALMESSATAIEEEPEAFSEYRLFKQRSKFDPKVVGRQTALNALARVEQREQGLPAT